MSKTIQAAEIIRELPRGLLQWYDFRAGTKALYLKPAAGLQKSGDNASTGLSESGTDAMEGMPGNGFDALADLLAECSLQVVCASVEQSCNGQWCREHTEEFDYIVCVEALEGQADPGQALVAWRRLLKQGGTLLLGMNNRFGIRYFCGDRDPYTERNFDGIEGYRRAYARREDVFRGRMYGRAEIEQLLREAGWDAFRFFSVFSDLQNPCLIYGGGLPA